MRNLESWITLALSMLREVLTEEVVLCDLQASTGTEVIDALLDMLESTGSLRDRAQAREDVLLNERRSSTGMQHGVAIPHAKTSAVDSLIAAVAVTRDPIEFDSLDGKPCRIFIMTLSPLDQNGPHMRFLAEIGRILKSGKNRKALLAATNSSELLHAFIGAS
ncbi:MAG: PTS sugar transporter subunit IIA [Alkalispirochaetaceae bacterium]